VEIARQLAAGSRLRRQAVAAPHLTPLRQRKPLAAFRSQGHLSAASLQGLESETITTPGGPAGTNGLGAACMATP